eukprot:CAMPEP_0181310990 /NCGR_PEP_ID=MMETSP1101-20121128/12891_1 /TAXON_ID=46948 /ORGANISM="Rhodomonas abbreviata, Strain Caron Lab Isolate" /LENGTH=436 /DNA_ID=CAMNT_0023417677 /DNA_START=73 /DNA_END=1383 /DNA_ORIENTATION=-
MATAALHGSQQHPPMSLDHGVFSNAGSQPSQEFTFGGGKAVFASKSHHDQNDNESQMPPMSRGSSGSSSKSADPEGLNNDGKRSSQSNKHGHDDQEETEQSQDQQAQEDIVYSQEIGTNNEVGLMQFDDFKALYRSHLQEVVKNSRDFEALDVPMDPLFRYFVANAQDRKEQGRIVVALIGIIVHNNVSNIPALLRYASSGDKKNGWTAEMGVEREMHSILRSLPDIFHQPATPASTSPSEVVTETPPSQPTTTPRQTPSRNLQKDMSPPVASGSKRSAAASPGDEADAQTQHEEGWPSSAEVNKHVEKVEELHSSVSVLKIKRRRLLQQVEHVRNLEHRRKDAEKACQATLKKYDGYKAEVDEAKKALQAAEARVHEAMKKEREEKEEAAVARLRAEAAAKEAQHARLTMEEEKKEFEQIYNRLRQTVGSSPQEK